jgi:hypothetical protein
MMPPEPQKRSRTKKRGPPPDRVKIKGDWTEAMKKALEKKRPTGGWPEPEKKPSK